MAAFNFKKLLPLISLVLFLGAGYVLYQEVQDYSWQQLYDHLAMLPEWQYLSAIALTAGVYFTLTFYDKLGFLYTGVSLPWRKIALGSFLGYAFSHNISPTLLVGGSMRYRIYSSMGISGLTVTNVVAFCAFSVWIGLMFIAALSFLINATTLPSRLNVEIPLLSLQTIGWLFVLGLIIYFILTRVVTGTVNFRGRVLRFPSTRIALGQLTVSSTDWLLSSAVLFLLLPAASEITYLHFAGIYIIAFMVGISTQIPGGLGVFETIILLFLYPFMQSGEILSALILFRILYFIIPLLVAIVILGIFEWRKNITRRRYPNPEPD